MSKLTILFHLIKLILRFIFLSFKKKNYLKHLNELILFFTYADKEFYKERFINRTVKNETTNQRLAFLLTGELRCWEQSKDLILSLSEKSKVFIMTDIKYKKILDEYDDKIIVFYSDGPELINKKNKIKNWRATQWFRFQHLVKKVLEYEKKNEITFNYFSKIRSDFGFLYPELLLNTTREKNEDCLFTYSDILFSGRREFFLPLMNLFTVAEEVYFNNKDYFIPINYSQILDSDINAIRSNWFPYPKNILKDHNPSPYYENSEQLHSYIKLKKNELIEFNQNKDISNQKLTETIGHPEMPSELIFARFLNLSGIICKKHNKFSGKLLDTRK